MPLSQPQSNEPGVLVQVAFFRAIRKFETITNKIVYNIVVDKNICKIKFLWLLFLLVSY